LAQASIGSGNATLIRISGGQAASYAVGPSGADFGIGAMSAAYGGTGQALQYEDTVLFNFTTKTTETLDLNLLSDNFSGIGFDSLKLVVAAVGAPSHTYTFSTLVSAQSFFGNHPLSLGSFASGNQSVSLDYVLTYNSGTKAAASVTGFGFAYDIAAPQLSSALVLPSSSVTAPEVSTWLMMLVGLAGLGWVGSRRSRTANA
jgi:hypothetical protein